MQNDLVCEDAEERDWFMSLEVLANVLSSEQRSFEIGGRLKCSPAGVVDGYLAGDL